MQVKRIQNSYSNNYNPNFQSAIVEKSAVKLIDNMTEAEQKEFHYIIQRLAGTKFWDMIISKPEINNAGLWCTFVNKKNPKKIYDLGVNTLSAKDSNVRIYPIIDKENSKTETITFSSPQRAQAMMDMHKKHSEEILQSNCKSTNLQRLTRWAEQLEFLDEAYRYMKLGEIYSTNGVQNTVIKKQTIFNKILKFFGFNNY